ncbi:RRM domain-containing protein [Trichostrongylus colubriformis]|uniref:RRM domain-containing protein n=1 Tax=Trichostrongylus colubriformis TaxID=6319 RepID=A0AAN8ILJ6_TRICO
MSDSTVSAGEKRAHNHGDGSIDAGYKNNLVKYSEFVIVADKNGDLLELPTTPDNSLFMTTLQSSYPGATGLKYKNPKTGALRAVAVDASGSKLLPPADGWDDKVFIVITSNARSERGSDVSVKRRKLGTSDGDSDSDGEGRLGRKRTADARDSVPATPRRPVDLIVLGVNFKTTDEAFKKYFEAFGTVSFAEVKRTAEGTSKGYGFVQMSTLEEEDKVMAMDHMIDGRRCEIRIPDQKQKDSSGNYTTAPRKTLINKVFVGRLTEKITEERLREFFNNEAKKVIESAAVVNVLIPRPFRGFAFVTFTHAEVADKMVRANHFVIDDVSVVVTFAVQRETSQQAGSSTQDIPPGFINDFLSSYGYAQSNAGYDESPILPVSFATREMFGYNSPSGEYPRPPHEGWVVPPLAIQGTPRSGRGVGGAHEKTRNGIFAKELETVAFPPAALQKGPQGSPHVVQPLPYMYSRDPRDGVGQAASNQIANGLDALNLNQKNPELLSAAWSAFFQTLNHGGAAPKPRKQW